MNAPRSAPPDEPSSVEADQDCLENDGERTFKYEDLQNRAIFFRGADSFLTVHANPPSGFWWNGTVLINKSYTVVDPQEETLLPVSGVQVFDFAGLKLTTHADGKLTCRNQTSAPASLQLVTPPVKPFLVQPGRDFYRYSSTVAGKIPFIGGTYAKLGSGIKLANEDSMAVFSNRLVVTDGVGSYPAAHMAAAHAAHKLARGEGSLQESFQWSCEFLRFYTRYFSQDKLPDAVGAAVEFEDNKAHFLSVGDSRWFVIRDGKIYKKSIVRNALAERILRGEISEIEAYCSSEFDIRKEASKFTSSFQSYTKNPNSFSSDLDECEIQPGDVIVLCTDGVDAIADHEFVDIFRNEPSLEAAYDAIVERVDFRNRRTQYLRDFFDQDGIKIGSGYAYSPRDNSTLVIGRVP